MNNDELKNVFNYINYSTYNNICKVMPIVNTTTVLANAAFLYEYPFVQNLINVSTIASVWLNFYLVFSNNRLYTKDVMVIRDLYNEFIKNYNSLNKMFEFNNPIQIHTMYNYLLYKGYLSKNCSFRFSNDSIQDVHSLFGANVFGGNGVCRHISSMLTDILTDYGIDTYNITCYLPQYSLDCQLLDKQKYSKREVIEWVNKNVDDFDAKKRCLSLIEKTYKQGKGCEFSKTYVTNNQKTKQLLGNHMISFCEFDDEKYFLDSTQNRIYRLNYFNKPLLSDHIADNIKITKGFPKIFNSFDNYKTIQEKMFSAKSCVSLEKEQKFISETMSICKKNNDVFESFYNNNCELYSEISNKLVKIK